MANNNIIFEVLAKGTEKFSGDIKNVSESLENFSKSAKSIGRDLSQIGSTVSLLGASLSGPLVLAFNNAAKTSSAAATEVKRFKDVTSAFQNDIATALVPTFNKLNNAVMNLYEAFSSLDSAFKQQLLQGALISGIFLTIAGVFIIIIGKAVALSSALTGLLSKFLLFASVNPIIIAVGVSVAVIVGLMIKFKSVADVVMSTFQTLFIFLQNGFLAVKIAIEGALYGASEAAQMVIDLLAKIPGPTQTAMQILSNEAQNVSNIMRSGMLQDMNQVSENAQEIGTIMAEGQGTWSLAFDEMKNSAQGLFSAFSTEGGEGSAAGAFVKGFTDGLEQIKIKIMDLKAQGVSFVTTLHSGLSTAFSDILTGSASAKEAFSALGKSMLKALADFVAQWLAFQILSKVFMVVAQAAGIAMATSLAIAWAPAAALASLATFGANAAPAMAGISSTVGLSNALAIPKFAVGTPEIPRDMVANVHRGETIVPETFASAIRSGKMTLAGPGGNSGGGVVFDFTGAQFNGVTESFVEQIFIKASEKIRNRTLAALPA